MNNDEDPLDELHRVREQIWLEAGGTVEGLFAFIKQREIEHKDSQRILPVPPMAPGDRKGEAA